MPAAERASRPRPTRPFWGDVRFVVGVGLVVLSAAGVWWVVSAARTTTPMLVASRTIVPGDPVSGDDLRVVDVSLGAAASAYGAPADLRDGLAATRTIGEGELVPLDALGDATDARVTRVVLESATDVPASIVEGSRVEVWHAPRAEDDTYDEPRILVADATVAAVVRDDGVIARSGASLEVVVPRTDVPAVLAAQAAGGALSIVPVGR